MSDYVERVRELKKLSGEYQKYMKLWIKMAKLDGYKVVEQKSNGGKPYYQIAKGDVMLYDCGATPEEAWENAYWDYDLPDYLNSISDVWPILVKLLKANLGTYNEPQAAQLDDSGFSFSASPFACDEVRSSSSNEDDVAYAICKAAEKWLT
jgi:hypothetical protein